MYTLKDILELEVAPALGCTEPAAVALCSAWAASIASADTFDSLDIVLDPNVYKNGLAVSIPGARGEYGIDLAAVLGVLCGNPEMKLEVLNPVDETILSIAKKILSENRINITVDYKKQGIYIKTILSTNGKVSEAVIEKLHDNITLLSLNGKDITSAHFPGRGSESDNRLHAMEKWLKERTLTEIICLLDTMDNDDYSFIKQGLDYNLKLAEYGIASGSGLGVGKTLNRLSIEGLIKKDMVLEAKILTSAASDARMSGVKMPAMSSGGSGNHGLTATLPIYAISRHIQSVHEQDILKAIALSHLITAYVKAFTGRLSAVCGCSIAAGAGAAAGISYLMGGTSNHISGAIKNLICDLAGIICDGAKNSCAFKLATAAGAAVQASLLSLHGLVVNQSDGIIASTPEDTMRNVGRLSTDGMIETDRTILQIMIDKKFTEKV